MCESWRLKYILRYEVSVSQSCYWDDYYYYDYDYYYYDYYRSNRHHQSVDEACDTYITVTGKDANFQVGQILGNRSNALQQHKDHCSKILPQGFDLTNSSECSLFYVIRLNFHKFWILIRM